MSVTVMTMEYKLDKKQKKNEDENSCKGIWSGDWTFQ